MFNKEIWKQKYKYGDERAPEDTFMRIASFAATNEHEWRDKSFQEMNALRFRPGGRILAGAGTDRKKSTLSNCCLIEPEVPIEEYVKEINGNSHNNRKLAYCKLCGQHALVFEEGCVKCLALFILKGWIGFATAAYSFCSLWRDQQKRLADGFG